MNKRTGLLILNGGAHVDTDGIYMPNHDTQARIDLGLELASERGIGTVAMVGGDAEVMRAYAEETRISEDFSIVADDTSRETIGNAHFSKRNIVIPNRWTHFDVVTADYHKDRVSWIFSRVFGYEADVHGACTNYSEVDKTKLNRNEHLLKLAARLILVGVDPGQDEKREQRLLSMLPAYSNSRLSTLNKGLRRALSPR